MNLVKKRKRELFETQWRKAIHLITNFTGIDEFDLGITSWVMPSQKELLTTLVKATKYNPCSFTKNLRLIYYLD